MAIQTQDPYQASTDLYKAPTLPSTQYQTPKVTNSYNQGTDAYKINQGYIDYLGRAATPEEIQYRGSRFNTNPLQSQLNDIRTSNEGMTTGRATNEVDRELQDKLSDYYRQGQTAQQTAQEQLNSLRAQYDTQRQGLSGGLRSYNTGLDNSLQQMLDDYNYSSQKVQNSINPAILAAREAAARSGLLNSTVSIDRVNNALNPLTMQLGELAQKYQTSTTGVERQRNDYLTNYLEQLNALTGKESADVGNVSSRAALQYQQLADQASQALGQRSGLINSRGAQYEDALRQYGLQNRQLDTQNKQYYDNLAEQIRQFNLTNAKT